MFTLSPSTKARFFDRAAILATVDRKRVRFLSRAGAYVRRRARTSIRRRKKVSQPGQPPSAHSTNNVATLKNILFAYDQNTQSVVVGPVGLNMLTGLGGTMRRGVVPGLLESGGEAAFLEWQGSGGRWFRADLRSRRRLGGRRMRLRRAFYRPRPFMAPALEIERQFFPAHWQAAVALA